jgi:CBS domain containing-hemolysin-like protein
MLTTATPLTDIPGLLLGANVSSATSAVLVSSDGGVQVNSNAGSQAVVVDIFLFVDGDITPKQIVQRRIYAVNSVIAPNVANWSFSVAVSGLSCTTSELRPRSSPPPLVHRRLSQAVG